MEWKLDLRIDGQPFAGQREAEEFAKEALEFLAHPPSARESRDKVEKKTELADKVLSILRKRMGTPTPGKWAKIKSRFRVRRGSIVESS